MFDQLTIFMTVSKVVCDEEWRCFWRQKPNINISGRDWGLAWATRHGILCTIRKTWDLGNHGDIISCTMSNSQLLVIRWRKERNLGIYIYRQPILQREWVKSHEKSEESKVGWVFRVTSGFGASPCIIFWHARVVYGCQEIGGIVEQQDLAATFSGKRLASWDGYSAGICDSQRVVPRLGPLAASGADEQLWWPTWVGESIAAPILQDGFAKQSVPRQGFPSFSKPILSQFIIVFPMFFHKNGGHLPLQDWSRELWEYALENGPCNQCVATCLSIAWLTLVSVEN